MARLELSDALILLGIDLEVISKSDLEEQIKFIRSLAEDHKIPPHRRRVYRKMLAFLKALKENP